jgi:hypothetical protein
MISQYSYRAIKMSTMAGFGLDKNLIRGVLWESITKKRKAR